MRILSKILSLLAVTALLLAPAACKSFEKAAGRTGKEITKSGKKLKKAVE